jgi:hypothetical protein
LHFLSLSLSLSLQNFLFYKDRVFTRTQLSLAESRSEI